MAAVSDVILRLAIALAAGATMRMLTVIGVAWPVALIGLTFVSAILSWRLIASRVFVVLLVASGYFVTYLMTQDPSAATVEENPALWDIAISSMLVFMPLALPAMGSMLSLQYEKRLDRRAKEAEPITEESLLNEKVPAKPEEIDYDSLLRE
jgi:hypothetical protein